MATPTLTGAPATEPTAGAATAAPEWGTQRAALILGGACWAGGTALVAGVGVL